ncbi:hypothetical protein EVJ58_g3831 [Rhodofomes roseus]|uniref:Xylanolytic transcriptional activator regulatory domain-containing protein n=1 Tax=Rhodofomes roseus TaxID=34475 RepID=A0A4Y9YIX7_9APHY|nr:hypothetical protein EVJ58_g3831 [Rhodofomes roseus]
MLAYTLEDLSSTLVDLHPPAIMDVLQAEVLLAYYFFSNNRTVEGVYHMDAASAIVLASRLHQIRSARYAAVAGGTASRYQLAPPVDAIDEGQRINAFWMTFILDRNWSLALGRTPVLTDDEPRGTEIDTPWPRCIETYEIDPLPEGVRNLRTVQTFLYDPIFSNDAHNPLAMHSKATALYSAAARIAAQSLAAALAAANVLGRMNIGSIVHVDPIIGFLLASVARILKRALVSLRQNAAAHGSNEENNLLVSLAHIRFAFETWGQRNAYIRSQQAALADVFQGL